MVVEDKESSGGTFSMKVLPTATIEKLQQEVTRNQMIEFLAYCNPDINWTFLMNFVHSIINNCLPSFFLTRVACSGII